MPASGCAGEGDGGGADGYVEDVGGGGGVALEVMGEVEMRVGFGKGVGGFG